MTDTTYRPIAGEEMAPIVNWLTSYAFQSTPPLPDLEERQARLLRDRGSMYFAAFEDGQPQACVAAARMTQQVRGEIYPMGGIWGVAAHPAARRKGHTRRLLAMLLEALRDEGHAFTCLYPFRESFYQRLGYTAFPQVRKAIFNPAALAPLLKDEIGGQVELHLLNDALPAYLDYTRRLQRLTHGMALFNFVDEQSAWHKMRWLALARSAGEVVGLMLYDLKTDRPMNFTLTAGRFYYHTPQGRYLLLEWLARHIDQAARIELRLAPSELPETWRADLDISVESAHPTPMGRVLDVSRIGGLACGPGEFTARIEDPFCPWNQGAWHFAAQDGLLHVRPAQGAPECTLTIQALSTLIYGTHDPADFRWRGWGNPAPELQVVLRTMFPPRLPYVHEMF